MISYQPFYETLLRENITEYALIFKHGIPANSTSSYEAWKTDYYNHIGYFM